MSLFTISLRTFTCGVGFLLLSLSNAGHAFTTNLPDRFAFSIGVAPRTSAVGSPRTLFANGCTGPVTLDESEVATTGALVMRIVPQSLGCIEPTKTVTFIPRSISTQRVVMKLPDGSNVAEAIIETVAQAHSTVNLDGMWFEPTTNGSGISFHHSAGSDNTFGTWFLYGAANTFVTRWYSLQNMKWTQSGAVLVGLAYEATASGVPTCVVGDDCPRPAAVRPVGSVTVSVIDESNVRVEAFDQYGRSAFVSQLKRLQF